jgi:hypothetical protein
MRVDPHRSAVCRPRITTMASITTLQGEQLILDQAVTQKTCGPQAFGDRLPGHRWQRGRHAHVGPEGQGHADLARRGPRYSRLNQSDCPILRMLAARSNTCSRQRAM